MDARRPITRRGFLARLSISAAGIAGIAAAPAIGAGHSPSNKQAPGQGRCRGGVMLDRATVETFAPCLGGLFEIHPEPDVVHDVRLIEAKAHPRRSAIPALREPFSLVFRGPEGVRLSQRIYTIRHPRLGTFPLFLVPIRPPSGPGAVDFEAVFG